MNGGVAMVAQMAFVDVVIYSFHYLLDPKVAEQVSKASKAFPTSIPKAYQNDLVYLTGPNSIVITHGDKWKTVRKRYNPAFSPPYILLFSNLRFHVPLLSQFFPFQMTV